MISQTIRVPWSLLRGFSAKKKSNLFLQSFQREHPTLLVLLCTYESPDARVLFLLQPHSTSPVLHRGHDKKKQSQVNTSCFTNWQSGRRRSNHPSPPLSPGGTSPPLSPLLFPLTIPPSFPPTPSLVGWSFQPTLQQKKQRRQGYSPPFSPTQRREEGCRPAGPPSLKMQRASTAKSADEQNSWVLQEEAKRSRWRVADVRMRRNVQVQRSSKVLLMRDDIITAF